MHPRWHRCKRHSSNVVDAVYMYTIKSMGRGLIAQSVWRSSGDQRMTVGAVGGLSSDKR